MTLNPADADRLRKHIVEVILEHVSRDEARRREALSEFFGVTLPAVDDAQTQRLAELVPPLLPVLYEKWANMFADRLFETVPEEQIEDLCRSGEKNRATLLLVYIMFMESERMEKQVAQDLRAHGLQLAPEAGQDAVASYLRARLSSLAAEARKLQ
ncbi:hypothetical protein [Desulfocurvibacter africanus]|uniref:Uncharacterized protein n=1 Tax=Desulfocurvibacter africanus subsp. africanus str. Walvis Bay TaxID=690850 RepID=F3YXR0_DESAF|nr:hypothetical protein [Desulfocurvibacter africanus]EGJ49504.1 hypothetical protein Desaf_1163 [Desulfocurvibacter africanus subsp. africanus str. Walvis Bay]